MDMIRGTGPVQLAAGFVPVNMAAAANDGDWVHLKHYGHLTIVLFKAAGGAGEPPTLTVEQATDAAGAGAKALPFTRVAVKSGADLQAIGQFTDVSQAAGNTYALAAGDTQAFVVVEFESAELDVANGYRFVRGRVADVGSTSQIGCLFYLLSESRNPGVSAIV